MPSDDWVLRLARGRQQQSREHGATEQRLLLIQAISAAVAENGFAHISVDEVGARAGLTSEIFHEHFQDLESCFLAAHDLGVEVLMTTVEDAIGSADRPALVRAERMVSTYLETLRAEPEFARTLLIEIYAVGPRALRRQREVMRRFAILWGEILGSEQDGGLDPLTCEALVGAVSSLTTTRVAAGEFDELQALREPIMGFAARLIAADPERRLANGGAERR